MTFRVGVIGAGQLARMMIPAAIDLDIDLQVFASAAGQSAQLAVSAVGDWTSSEDVRRFAAGVDVLTFEHEHVPQAVLRALEHDGVVVRPGSAALEYAQNKLSMRRRLGELGLPVPEWAAARSGAEVDAFVATHHGVAIAKQPVGGYDGHGVRRVSGADQLGDWFDPPALAAQGGALLLEEAVDFRCEVSQLVARRPSGQVACWPLTETIQAHGVCSEAIAPAPGAPGELLEQAQDVATAIATGLDVTGVLAVEMFVASDGRLLVNELAMRPHNSGHWTIGGSETDQFEQHLRAVLDLPLGDTGMRAPVVAMVNVLGGPRTGDDRARAEAVMLAAEPSAKLHWYGKSYRPHRKVGHVNAFGDTVAAVLPRARRAADLLHRDATGGPGSTALSASYAKMSGGYRSAPDRGEGNSG